VIASQDDVIASQVDVIASLYLEASGEIDDRGLALASNNPSPYPLPLDGFAVGEGGEAIKKELTPFPCGRG
jgi:hypothetical protein